MSPLCRHVTNLHLRSSMTEEERPTPPPGQIVIAVRRAERRRRILRARAAAHSRVPGRLCEASCARPLAPRGVTSATGVPAPLLKTRLVVVNIDLPPGARSPTAIAVIIDFIL